MEELLGLHTWGVDIIGWVQSWSNGTLDVFFSGITQLGYVPFYLLLIPLIYWCINRSAGMRLFALAILSSWTGEILKNLFRLPRPSAEVVRKLDSIVGYGLPSNHAQTGAMVIWGYLAVKMRKAWFTMVAVALIILITLSRIYLGAHFPQDVLAGLVVGLVILLIALRFEERIALWWHSLDASRQAAVVALLTLLMLLSVPLDIHGRYPTEEAGTLSGIMLGAGLGAIAEARWVRFRVDGPPARRALRYGVGLILIFAVYLLGSLIPDLQPWGLDLAVRVLRYGTVGLTAVWLAPWLFVKTRLAESDPITT